MQVTANFDKFIDVKANQLCFYVQAFWHKDVAHQELQYFFWDTLEEWNQIKPTPNTPYSRKEQVFWHFIQQVHFWPEHELRSNVFLLDELRNCIHYLLKEGLCPFDCIGVRPN